MRPGRSRRAPVVAGCAMAALAVAVSLVGGAGPAVAAPGSAPAVVVDASTTTVPPTTTTVPPTTTTVPPTTTTVPPTTTTTRPERATTTIATSTTTTLAPLIAKKTSSTPWALIVVIVVLVLAILLVVLLLLSRRRRAAEAAWRRQVVPALSDAQLARESLLSGNAASDDAEVRGAVEVQADRAATALERTVATAPDPQAGQLAASAAGALRGLAFAIEADRLLRHGTAVPSGAQLAQADEARRARASELNTALVRLSTRIGSGPPGST